MFRSAKPAQDPLLLFERTGPYGADLQTDPANTAAVWVAESHEDALACVAQTPPASGIYPGTRLSPGMTISVPGRDDSGGAKRVYVVAESGAQWVVGQSF